MDRQLKRLLAIGLMAVATLTLAAPAAESGPAAAAAPPEAQAQAPADTIVELRLTDGSVIYGTVQADTPDHVVVLTLSGTTIDVPRTQIASMQPARGSVVNGEFLPADANATRLLFSPTGRSLSKGQAYVGVYEFLLPFVQVGVTDRFSIGIGTPLIFFGDDSGHPVWLTPKFQVYRGKRTSAAIGVMHFLLFDDTRAGLAYAVATTGTSDNAVTTGVGWAYSRYHENHYSPCYRPSPGASFVCPPSTRTTETTGAPVGMLGGARRVSRRVKLVTENYGFENGGILSGGVRFLGEHLSADLGLFIPLGADEFIAAPIVNFVWTFGR